MNGIVVETKEGQNRTPVASEWSPVVAARGPLSLQEIKRRLFTPVAMLSTFGLMLVSPIRHLFPQPFWVGLFVIIPHFGRIATEANHFTEKDKELLHDATEGQALVFIEVKQDGLVTGRDRGLLWVDEGRLVFSGRRSAFVLRQDDLTKECLDRLRGLRDSHNGREWAGKICLRYSRSNLEVRVGEIDAPSSEKKTWSDEPANGLVRFARLFVVPGPDSFAAVVAAFAEGTHPVGPSQYPPLKVDPQIRYPPPPGVWIAGATLSAAGFLACFTQSQVEPFFIAAMVLAFCGYETYRALQFKRLRRQNP